MSGLSLRARVGLGWQVPAPDLGSGPEGDPGISLIPMTDKRGVCGLAWVPKFNYPHTSIKLPPKRLIIVKRGKKCFPSINWKPGLHRQFLLPCLFQKELLIGTL